MMLRNLFFLFFLSFPILVSAQSDPSTLSNCVILKETFNRRIKFSDVVADGKFLFLKIEFTNLDKNSHVVDFSNFCVVDAQGIEYEVHVEATIERQTRFEDFRRGETVRFAKQQLNPHMRIESWLVFDVPDEGEYKLKFRGYSK